MGIHYNEEKMHNINWETICTPTIEEGLDIPKASIRNLTLIMNLAYIFQFINKDMI